MPSSVRILSAARYDIALEQATAPLHFSSRAAKSAFLSAARAKNLPIEEGKLQGFGEFQRQFEENDPGAFSRGAGGGEGHRRGNYELWE